ncbi:uncharacterized protein KQ657_001114 [Scheffersomyces spartinae]|uniref:Nuclear condensin complex subunit 3 C-terminal domain-containing protein n=1 Tax=Scheffersomyces spartinae TaxID=45513 RepID=A0A9P8AH66_9ASCO|nr:uncharacterized protein KQ657_001114 [Scheffersomyces spartinae]KAG7193001.1 hypothetical protein KQ657_001114 [Scheffersomyces spartinae]
MARRKEKPVPPLVAGIVDADSLRNAMATLFQEAQHTTSSHRKLVIMLGLVFNKSVEIGLLDSFGFHFTKLINKSLGLKKGERAADRIAKYVAVFVGALNAEGGGGQTITTTKYDEDLVSRFVNYMVLHLLRGVDSKDKNVRFRVVQLLGYLIIQLQEIDHEVYQALRAVLIARLKDKESIVRIQAIVALSRFQSIEGDDIEDEDKNDLITEEVKKAMRCDEVAEVRRAALINLKRDKSTIPDLLERARDLNGINRRLVFTRLLKELGGYSVLTNKEREQLLTWSFNDRDELVVRASLKLVTGDWYTAVGNDLEELVGAFNVTKSEVAELTMQNIYKASHETLGLLNIDKINLKLLTVERVFILRTFYTYCDKNNLYEMIDSIYPESAELAVVLGKYLEVRMKQIESDKEASSLIATKNQRLRQFRNTRSQMLARMYKALADREKLKKTLVELSTEIDHINGYITEIKDRLYKLRTGLADRVPLQAGDEDPSEEDYFLSFTPEQLHGESKSAKKALKDVNEKVEEVKGQRNELKIKLTDLDLDFDNINNEIEITLSDSMQNQKLVEYNESLDDVNFIIENLLLIAADFDFGDEVGRREMLKVIREQLLRNHLTGQAFSEKLVEVTLRVLKRISYHERDFAAMCTEIVNDILDDGAQDDAEDTFHSAHDGFDEDSSSEDEEGSSHLKKKRKVETPFTIDEEIALRCLKITKHVLELIETPLEQDTSLSSLRFSLVNYALRQSDIADIYALGLECLGLFCLLDKSCAKDNFDMFLRKLKDTPESIRIICFKAIVDILSSYGVSGLEKEDIGFQIARSFFRNLKDDTMPKLQAVVAGGICKLFLADIFGETNKEVDLGNEHELQLLESLVITYFRTHTGVNEELRQTLSFCIPVYAFSYTTHQMRIAQLCGDCFFRLFPSEVIEEKVIDDDKEEEQQQGGRKKKRNRRTKKDEYKEGDEKRITELAPTRVLLQLIQWCDPRNIVNVSIEDANKSSSHLLLCASMLSILDDKDTSKSAKKAVVNSLGKLFFGDNITLPGMKSLQQSLNATKLIIYDDTLGTYDKHNRKNMQAFCESIDLAVAQLERKAELAGVLIIDLEPDVEADTGLNSEKEENPEEDKEEEVEEEEEEEGENQLVREDVQPKTDADLEMERTLDRIDKLLYEEEKVEYDIAMEDAEDAKETEAAEHLQTSDGGIEAIHGTENGTNNIEVDVRVEEEVHSSSSSG